MQIKDYISEEGMVFSPSVTSKKAALEVLSDTLAHQDINLSKNKVLDALLAREKLGSTGLGEGIAIPHCRMQELESIYVTMLKLEEGVEYEAADDKPVFFLFCLVVPEDANEDHLQLLASLAELLDNEQLRNSIQKSSNARELYQILTQDPKHLAA
ncbi:MAG: PTS sugar transporter subunit IIA [Gammaproteobacteria bacterium]|nr:PTS sugar transporter subunit IIA [Gammaproteobacteria bacterium]MDH3607781.1 PTS sugar transporter subunit IIA [Gammaproteobacteria bacterium]NNC67828.1 PTS transporter subunit EIIA [Gammaproteobacteria bacterium]